MGSFLLSCSKRLIPIVFSAASLFGEENPFERRKNILLQLDNWLENLTPAPLKSFALASEDVAFTYADPPIEFSAFSLEHGFFSSRAPLISRATEDVADVISVQNALHAVAKSSSPFFIELATAELLCKALAYRNLQKGMQIQIPTCIKGTAHLIDYVVDEVLDLWQGMPAFGLIAKKKGYAPILLFRGTDLSLDSKKSWASLLSDLDLSGTGLSTFHFARKDIHDWLVKADTISQSKAKLMGFSLGGILVLYTIFFETEWVAKEGSVVFNPPGVPASIAKKWDHIHDLHTTYITQGDVICKLGTQPPILFAFSGKEPMPPIKAHTQLMTAEPVFFLEKVKQTSSTK